MLPDHDRRRNETGDPVAQPGLRTLHRWRRHQHRRRERQSEGRTPDPQSAHAQRASSGTAETLLYGLPPLLKACVDQTR